MIERIEAIAATETFLRRVMNVPGAAASA